MADEESNQEKTQEPSQRRIDQYREEGQVAQSRDLASVVVLFAVLLTLYFTWHNMFNVFNDYFHKVGEFSKSKPFDKEYLLLLIKGTIGAFNSAVTPILIAAAVCGILVYLIQTGVLFTTKTISPDIEKINPLKGFSRMFSLNSVVEGLKSIAKIALVGYIAYLIIKSEIFGSNQLMNLGVYALFAHLGAASLKIFSSIVGAITVIAGLDYLYQRRRLEQQMKMTIEDAKRERKEYEGDPLIKSRIRRIQRDIATKRMMQAVPKADVVITNPTHFAVALRYDLGKMKAPVVVAKGADFLAARIREIAKKHGVPLVEDKVTAQLLYKTVKVGREIPRSLWKAVATILTQIEKFKKKISA